MSTISNITPNPPDTSASFLNSEPSVPRATGGDTLNVNDFLKLITVQMTNQDPMKPMEDTQFISQMASFTSLEQMKTLTSNFSTFSTAQEISNAQALLGKSVTIDTGYGNITGPVTSVTIENGIPLLSVNGGSFAPSSVMSVSAPSSNNTPASQN